MTAGPVACCPPAPAGLLWGVSVAVGSCLSHQLSAFVVRTALPISGFITGKVWQPVFKFGISMPVTYEFSVLTLVQWRT